MGEFLSAMHPIAALSQRRNLKKQNHGSEAESFLCYVMLCYVITLKIYQLLFRPEVLA